MLIEWATPPYGVDDLEPGAADGYRTPASLLREGDKVRCCVGGCHRLLPRRARGKPATFCPIHGISVSMSPTYVYQDWKRNILLRHDLMAVVKQLKVESWRLGSETSEDALSWNVFVGLAHLGGLSEAFEALTGRKARSAPQLFLWGVEVSPTEEPRFWSRLAEVRAELEPRLPTPTEPDIMLWVPGQAIVLIEAKFGSPNGTLGRKKDGNPHDFLTRYRPPSGRSDPLDRQNILSKPPDEILEQLSRNVLFATWLARGDEEPFVANLVRASVETDVEERMHQHLSAAAQTRLRRVAWETLGRLPTMQRPEAASLSHYLQNKTLRLQPAFTTAP
ncbi:MAG: hypothetical protein Q8P50_04080 [Bacillota bacterium]|nr:hypothetical protein [Bacillota bacterium]